MSARLTPEDADILHAPHPKERQPARRRPDGEAALIEGVPAAVGQLDAYSRRLEAKFDALAESAKGKT